MSVLVRHPLTRTVAVLLLPLMSACAASPGPTGVSPVAQEPFDTLVTAEWLDEHLGAPDLVVLDCSVLVERAEAGGLREVSGRARYEAGHIPTAGFADLTGDLSDGEARFRFTIPAPERFAAAMAALGVGDDTRVVLYDTDGMGWAARVWWMLRWIGFDRAALLDGGLKAWTAAGLPLSAEPVARPARRLTPAVRPALIADRDEVRAALGDESVTIVDSLPEAHFRGEMSLYERPGHIPGAVNVSVFSLLDETGRFRPGDELEWLFDMNREDRAITYCGGGIAASANAFIMTRLGFTNVAVYAGSLQEWAADPANPLETGAGSREDGP